MSEMGVDQKLIKGVLLSGEHNQFSLLGELSNNWALLDTLITKYAQGLVICYAHFSSCQFLGFIWGTLKYWCIG